MEGWARTRRRQAALVFGAALVTLTMTTAAVTALTATPAGAAGDPSLDRLLLVNPVPGWGLLSPGVLRSLVSFEDRTESAATNEPATSAVEGWQGDSDTQRLILVMVRLPTNIPYVDHNSREGVIAGCASATGNSPTDVGPDADVPGSEEGSCSGTNQLGHTIDATVMTWIRGNVIVFLIGVGLPTAHVESIAFHQDRAIPASGVQDASSETGVVVAVVAGLVVAVGLVTTVLLRRRAQRRRAAASVPAWSAPGWAPPVWTPGNVGPPAEWMPDPTGRYELRYWSGLEWTEHVSTHGVATLDPLAAAPPVASDRVAGDQVPGDSSGGPAVGGFPVGGAGVPPAVGTLSADGVSFWNGVGWRSTTSTDGRMRWTGTQWVATGDSPPPA